MERYAMKKLLQWKHNENRKPLIIRGARHVGKTWLMKEFGKTAYNKTVYINFEDDNYRVEQFGSAESIDSFFKEIELNNRNTTLLILDEIHSHPKIITFLKHICIVAPQVHIVCASSVFGEIADVEDDFIEVMNLYPLSYQEFLRAMGKGRFVDLLNEGDFEMANVFRHEYIDQLKVYCFIGGMPEVVSCFLTNHDFNEARRIQERMLMEYQHDFEKHAPKREMKRIKAIWDIAPHQLSKENRKFTFALIENGARTKEYERSLKWLEDSAVLKRVHRIRLTETSIDKRSFNIFVVDVGLLCCLIGLNQRILLDGDALFTTHNGAICHQYVCQQLMTVDNLKIFTWTNSRGSAVIDFLLKTEQDVIPLVIQPVPNRKDKRLKAFRDKYRTNIEFVIVVEYTSFGEYIKVPLWLMESICTLVERKGENKPTK